MKNSFLSFFGIMCIAVILFSFVYVTFVPTGRAKWNTYWNQMRKVDDATLYQTRKSVEDNCRAMMASYTADVLIYEQYKNSDGEKQSWGEQAKMRANKTAASYNEFILKNSYVWKDNVPVDIKKKLEYVK